MKKILKFRIEERHKRILKMIKEHKVRFLLAIFCMMIVAMTSAALAYLLKPVLDDVFINKDKKMLLIIPLVIVAVYFLRSVASYGQTYFMSYVGESIIRRLRNMLYERIVDLPLSFYYQQKTGTLMSRITNDVNIIKSMVSTVVTSAIRDLFTVIFLIVYIFILHWKLALIAIVIEPLAFYPIIIFGRRLRRVSTGWQEAMADLNVFLHETFAGSKIVKAFGMEGHEKKTFF